MQRLASWLHCGCKAAQLQCCLMLSVLDCEVLELSAPQMFRPGAAGRAQGRGCQARLDGWTSGEAWKGRARGAG